MIENSKPLLSICIPKYNREKYLKRLLDSIVVQNEFKNTNYVEIVISDNASTDGTKEMVTNYIKDYGNRIKFFENNENIGMCGNLYKVRLLGTGKYLRLMGSDQKLSSNSIGLMLAELEQSSAKTVIISNSEDNTNSSSLVFNGFSDFSTYIGQHKLDFLDIEGGLLTFMSYCCMSHEYFLQSLDFMKKIIGEKTLINNYFNFNVIRYSQLYGNDSILYIKNHIFIPVSDAESSWTINKKIVKDLLFIINYIENNYFVSKFARKAFKSIKRIRIVAYITFPLKKLFKLFHLEEIYSKLGGLYRIYLHKI